MLSLKYVRRFIWWQNIKIIYIMIAEAVQTETVYLELQPDVSW